MRPGRAGPGTLDSGELGLNEIINDTGSFDPGDGNVLHNAGDAVNGPIDLVDALRVSSDVFFYIMGSRTNVNSRSGGSAAGVGQGARLRRADRPRHRRRGGRQRADSGRAQRGVQGEH